MSMVERPPTDRSEERIAALREERRRVRTQLPHTLTAASDPLAEQHEFARSYLAVLLGRLHRLDAALERMVRPGRTRL